MVWLLSQAEIHWLHLKPSNETMCSPPAKANQSASRLLSVRVKCVRSLLWFYTYHSPRNELRMPQIDRWATRWKFAWVTLIHKPVCEYIHTKCYNHSKKSKTHPSTGQARFEQGAATAIPIDSISVETIFKPWIDVSPVVPHRAFVKYRSLR